MKSQVAQYSNDWKPALSVNNWTTNRTRLSPDERTVGGIRAVRGLCTSRVQWHIAEGDEWRRRRSAANCEVDAERVADLAETGAELRQIIKKLTLISRDGVRRDDGFYEEANEQQSLPVIRRCTVDVRQVIK